MSLTSSRSRCDSKNAWLLKGIRFNCNKSLALLARGITRGDLPETQREGMTTTHFVLVG